MNISFLVYLAGVSILGFSYQWLKGALGGPMLMVLVIAYLAFLRLIAGYAAMRANQTESLKRDDN